MSKDISTLVEDIYAVIQGQGGWDEVISKSFVNDVGALMAKRLAPTSPDPAKPYLRMSSIGQPCSRKLWYSINMKTEASQPAPANLLKFLQGDLLEALLISLAKAAGHDVAGEQDVVYCHGIRGQRDCVIDGVTVDIKSASAAAMKKFSTHSLREDDPFGYIRQLTGYVKGAKDDPIVRDKTHGAFLAIDKANGTLVLDMYDLTKEIDTMEDHIESVRACVSSSIPPPRSFEDIPEGKSGNYKLDTPCVFCEYKRQCWPKLRAFKYSWGTIYLTRVEREPDKRIQEVDVE
jgi:hypothetical protein